MAKAFEVSRVSANPARFDLKKCTSINGDWIRHLSQQDIAERLIPYLISDNLLPEVPTSAQRELVHQAVGLVQERMETLRQGAHMMGFFFASDPGLESDVTSGVAGFAIDESELGQLTDDARTALAAAATALDALSDWCAASIEASLRAALIDGLGLKPKFAFGPVRLATAGRRVSPPLFESLELLGKDRSLHRMRAVLH
jgi:glutamyl-tRNA synthetase